MSSLLKWQILFQRFESIEALFSNLSAYIKKFAYARREELSASVRTLAQNTGS